MPNYWGEPISNKILFALNSTWPRLLLGAWCAIGPLQKPISVAAIEAVVEQLILSENAAA